MTTSPVPGVRFDLAPPAGDPVRTGIPLFAGLAAGTYDATAACVTAWTDLPARFRGAPADGFLADAVHGFFANGGERCWVVQVRSDVADPVVALRAALDATEHLTEVDLVCVPDACSLRPAGLLAGLPVDAAAVEALQLAVIDHCTETCRFAILDALPGLGRAAVVEQRSRLTSRDAALYHPWIRVQPVDGAEPRLVPPSGHVAGIYAATDARSGVHKPPANELVQEALDLEVAVDEAAQAELNPLGVNCLRSFPGRGIRVWGARTLSPAPAWRHVNVRRVVLTVERWLAAHLGWVVFEPNDGALRARVGRELSAHLAELHRRGALRGAAPEEAFFVRFDAADPDRLVVEVGLAPQHPNEFVVVHVVHQAGAVSVLGPSGST